MNPAELKIGDLIDLTIKRETENTYIVGEVLGIRQAYFNPDQIAVLIGGIDIWLELDENAEVRLGDI